MLSFDSALKRAGFVELTGTLGTAVLPDPNRFDGSTRCTCRGTTSRKSCQRKDMRLRAAPAPLELARAIRAGVPERASGELAYHVLDAMLAIDESMTRGQGVEVASTVEVPPALPAGWDPYAKTL